MGETLFGPLCPTPYSSTNPGLGWLRYSYLRLRPSLWLFISSVIKRKSSTSSISLHLFLPFSIPFYSLLSSAAVLLSRVECVKQPGHLPPSPFARLPPPPPRRGRTLSCMARCSGWAGEKRCPTLLQYQQMKFPGKRFPCISHPHFYLLLFTSI